MGRVIRIGLMAVLAAAVAAPAAAQGFESEPVFQVRLVADRAPAVAGEPLRLAVVLDVDRGWHVNSDEPGDDFSLPTTLGWVMPEGWPPPVVAFPDGTPLQFEFSEQPIEVWEGRVVIPAGTAVPEGASGTARVAVEVTAQACNDTQCLAPVGVSAATELVVAGVGSEWQPANAELFETVAVADDGGTAGDDPFTGRSLPLLLVLVFLAGLGLNLTPCVFPLIPITIGYFSEQAKRRTGGTFWLALAYVVGIALTYSVLGVLAALGGALFGGILQNPWVVAVIVAVLLALAAAMFGAWEFRVPLPAWAQSDRGGAAGALVMGLVMGLVAAPCIGPFVLGLVTFVGERGDPVFGFVLFFALALGLGVPYLLLGTFTGLVNKLPASGIWMVGVRRVFGVILVAMAAYFAAPLLPGEAGGWSMAAVLVLGGLYLLVVDRTGHEQPAIDRAMRLLCTAMVVAGLWLAPAPAGRVGGTAGGTAAGPSGHLEWAPYDASQVEAAAAAGTPVILDFYADWCAPCKELDEKTFADPGVRAELAGYARFKVDLTRSTEAGRRLTETFDVRGVPTVIVLDGAGERFRITGFEPPEQFLERLRG